jgi:putative alpha-1,2-mannosidase
MKLIPYVNIKMGTKSVFRRSNGNTLPLTQLPFGMVSFCPQTDEAVGWFYHPDNEYCEGIRLTHQPSPWIRDYGPYLMTPQNDNVADRSSLAWSGCRVQDSVLRPDYMKVTFLRSNCTFELTPTERCAALRLTFRDDRPSFLSFLPIIGNYTYRFDQKTSTLIGTNDGHSMDDSKDFTHYIAVRFLNGLDFERNYSVGENEKAAFHVGVKSGVVEARLGSSYISAEMALAAIERECGNKSFEQIQIEAEENWEEKLHRIEIETDDEELNSFLFSLGCYEGEPITVVSHLKKSCVVSIKDGRYNIDHQLAEAILV